MTSTLTATRVKPLDLDFTLPDVDSAAGNAIASALNFTAGKMQLADSDAVLSLLRSGSGEARGYFEYGLARQIAEYIGALDDEVQAAYLYDAEATPEDFIFGRIQPMLVHVAVWARRKTSALNSLIAALDRAVSERYAAVSETSAPAHMLDIQIVDDAEVASRSGFGAMLTWLHHRPLMVWKR